MSTLQFKVLIPKPCVNPWVPHMNLSRSRSKLIHRLHRRCSRVREGAYLAEGVRGVAEIVDAGAEVRFAVKAPRLNDVPGGPELAQSLDARGIEVVPADDSTLAGLAATETPQGILAVCNEPRMEVAAPARVLLADAIQDPGNMGTLIRSAAAFGVDLVVALDGCVDPFNAKTVRASAGTIARVPVKIATWDEVAARLDGWNLPLCYAAATADSEPISSTRWVLAVGNEGRGVRPAIRDTASTGIAIPMASRIDSLNAGVAGSILMYLLTTGEATQ
ncbi:MAG: RNA methyltransferase [Acidobacteria bacterium]|nr:RNA methyltransferase [Acidobacteriota bacterium]